MKTSLDHRDQGDFVRMYEIVPIATKKIVAYFVMRLTMLIWKFIEAKTFFGRYSGDVNRLEHNVSYSEIFLKNKYNWIN